MTSRRCLELAVENRPPDFALAAGSTAHAIDVPLVMDRASAQATIQTRRRTSRRPRIASKAQNDDHAALLCVTSFPLSNTRDPPPRRVPVPTSMPTTTRNEFRRLVSPNQSNQLAKFENGPHQGWPRGGASPTCLPTLPRFLMGCETDTGMKLCLCIPAAVALALERRPCPSVVIESACHGPPPPAS